MKYSLDQALNITEKKPPTIPSNDIKVIKTNINFYPHDFRPINLAQHIIGIAPDIITPAVPPSSPK